MKIGGDVRRTGSTTMRVSFLIQCRRGLRATWREIVYIWARRPFLLLLIFLLLALAKRMGVPPRQAGDGAEYFVMTRSLARERNLVITPAETEVFRHPDSPWPRVVLEPHKEPLIRGRDGRERCVHSFVVPALVTPFYWLCGWIAPGRGPFHCYSVFGLWALLVSGYLLGRFWQSRLSEGAERWQRWALPVVAFIVIFFTPLLIYSYWAHGEAAVFFLLCLFFFWLEKDRLIPAGLALGLAAGHNPIAGIWGGLLLAKGYRYWRENRETVEFKQGAWRYVAAIAAAAAPALVLAGYNLYHYGTPSVLLRYDNCVPELFGLERTLRFYWDPFFGLVWFYPWALLGFFSPQARRVLVVRFLLSLPLAAVCMATANLNSHMVGLRYLAFVYPAFLFVPFEIPKPHAVRAALGVYVAACLWITWPFVARQRHAENFCWTLENKAYVGIRTVFSLVPALYNPEPECFMENVFHQNIPHTQQDRPRVFRARVSPTCWFVLVERKVLPPGKAALIIQRRGGQEQIAARPVRFGINSMLTLGTARLDPRGADYRLEFSVAPDDFLSDPLRGDYLYLKFRHPSLKPVALQRADGTLIPLPEY
ncbi:MAG: hypothetical protein N3D11_10270 [Candidatus Sumerlaeia bacterium]|nr:hypothetical protein [Candidatus Sumerlaeia bacterium]